MRAWQCVKPGRPRNALSLNEAAPAPEPYPGTILLDVVAAGMGLPDVFMCQGSYHLTPSTLPFTQGQEVIGRVAGWGEGVEGRQVGDLVMAVTSFFTGNGGYAQQCLGLDDFCLPVPEGMSDAEASGFLIPFHTAHLALVQRGKLTPGETLLVIGGAGGTGQAAMQIGKALGARVIATAGGAEKAAFCRDLGADHVVDYHSEDIAEGVKAATDGRGADAIYDPVGGKAFQSAMQCVAHEGRILAIGFASGSWGKADTSHMVYNNYSVVGVIPSNYGRDFKQRAQEELLGWWRAGKLRPRVDSLVPFEGLPDALERLASGGVKGKLSLAVDPAASSPA
jgi:NADPH2:quinone reductase